MANSLFSLELSIISFAYFIVIAILVCLPFVHKQITNQDAKA